MRGLPLNYVLSHHPLDAMSRPASEQRTRPDWMAWAMIVLGAVAILLALWDVVVEGDGGFFESIAILAVGALVIALGIQRRRRI